MNVRLPTMLESYAGGERDVQAEGGTVAELLQDLDEGIVILQSLSGG